MTHSPDTPSGTPKPHEPGNGSVSADQSKAEKKSISMHADVPVWYDCCSCEAEPYWQQAMEEAEQKQENSED
jgi:hypothetical protein